jgi:hypothetical protein
MKQDTDGQLKSGNGELEITNWQSPIFKPIPISFEASSYALSDDDPPPYK